MSNKKTGEDFEKEVLKILKENKFWATKLKEKEMGGPFDIVATKNNMFISLEAKNINKGTIFPLSRVEPNQISGFKRLSMVGSGSYSFFIFKAKNEVFLLHSEDVIDKIELGESSLDVSKGVKLVEWLKLFEN